jgi:hypothetical protein
VAFIDNLARRSPKSVKRLARSIGMGRIVRILRRRAFAMSFYSETLRTIKRWYWADTEDFNFYYQLTPLNRDQLAQLIAVISGQTYATIVGYFEELETDQELRQHMEQGIITAEYGSEIKINFGRRLGWYAFVRCMRPKVIVETGVDHGIGSCVLTSALLRNGDEGFPGHYYGTDIRPEAGALLSGKYASTGRILYGDSIASLRQLTDPIDLFINDSDHSSEYEYQEYLTVAEKLSSNAIILGDNSHLTDRLSRFSQERNRKFIFFAEKPLNHWYPGAGIGISFT